MGLRDRRHASEVEGVQPPKRGLTIGLKIEHTAATGNGPVAALDGGVGAIVRVLIESGDQHDRWGTVGVSHNLIEASWQALVDSLDYKLYKDGKRRRTPADGSAEPVRRAAHGGVA